MRSARPSAFIVAVLTAALIWTAAWHMTPEVATEQPMVNGPVTRLDASNAPRFRCDSLFAKDCFEMFHRRTAVATTTVRDSR
jgi:hypothetical protein